MSFISNSALSLHHILAVLSALIFFSEKPKKIKLNKSHWALLALVVALMFSVFMNWESLAKPIKNLLKIKYVFIAALLGILVNVHKEKLSNHLGNILSLFIVSYSAANLWGLAKYFKNLFTSPDVEFRLSGFFGMVMSYAYAAVLPMGLLLFLLLHPTLSTKLKKSSSHYLSFIFSKKTLLALFTISLATLYLTLTRGALVGALLVIPMLVFSKSKKWALICSLVSILVVAVGVALAFSNKDFQSRLFLKASHQGNSERLAQNTMGLKAFQENPLFGIGFRAFEQKGREIKERHNLGFLEAQTHAHNNYLEILGSAGLMGFVFFLLWIAFWIQESFQQKLWRSYSLAVIAAFLAMGLFQSTFIDSEYIFTLLSLYTLGPVFRFWG